MNTNELTQQDKERLIEFINIELSYGGNKYTNALLKLDKLLKL